MADQPSFSGKLFQYLERLELILLAAFAGGLLTRYMGLSASETIIMFSLSGLAGVYFLNAYKPPASQPPSEVKKDFVALASQTILPKLLWISSSVCVIGLLFFLLQLEGHPQQLMVGALASAVGVVLYVILSLMGSKEAEALSPVLYRAIPLLLMALYFLYVISGK